MVLGIYVCYVCWSVWYLPYKSQDNLCECGAVLEDTGHIEANINMKEGKQ